MASQGGHWFWSASLRYVFMWLLLSAMIGIKSGVGTLVGLCRLFGEHYKFWCIALLSDWILFPDWQSTGLVCHSPTINTSFWRCATTWYADAIGDELDWHCDGERWYCVILLDAKLDEFTV